MQRSIVSQVGFILTRWSFALLLLLTSGARTNAMVTPAPGRTFCTHPTTGADIIAQMTAEAANPVISSVLIHFRNDNPPQVVDPRTGKTSIFDEWTGTLISPEWVLTCAHAVQGTDGRGAGVNPGDIYYNFGGSSFPDPASARVAEIHLHPSWALEDYEHGNDIALIRLSVPVAGVANFPRLAATAFVAPKAVILAGYGKQGNGDIGETGSPGVLAVGLNTLDAVGGQAMSNGNGANNPAFVNWPASVAFMDFDKWERRDLMCNGQVGTFAEFLLSAFSTMGVENEVTAPVAQPCAVAGGFLSSYCDFLPAGGDSGGPAFLSPTLPNIPPNGFYLTTPATLVGVVSYRGPGTQVDATSLYGNVAGYTLVQPRLAWIYQTAREVADRDTDHDGRTDEAEFLAGSDPYSPPHTPATFLQRTFDIFLENIRILQEQLVGANETEIEFTADLRNGDTGRYFDLSLNVDRAALPAGATVVDPQLNYASLTEQGTAPAGATETLVVRVANSDLESVRQQILSGQILSVSAFEEQVYAGPTKFVDQPTDESFSTVTFNGAGEMVLVFDVETDLIDHLQPGDILIADTSTGGYDPQQPSPTDPFAIPYLSEQLPFAVSSVTLVDGKIHVAGDKKDLSEILKSGTFVASDENFNGGGRDLLDPPVENTYTEDEKSDRSDLADLYEALDPTDPRLADLGGLNAIPWRFNDLEITKSLHLSGQVLLRSSGLRFQVSFRDFQLRRASVGIDAGVVASMVLETTGTNNNIAAPLADKEKELARIPLPRVPITIAGVPCSIGPTFVLSVGAEATAPGGLSIPLETSVTLGTEIGWADGETFTTPIKEFVAPHVSDPTVFDAVEASARAWAEARFEVDISVAGGLAKAGPSLAVRAEAGFNVAPFSDPWWSLDVGADLVGAFEMDLLGLQVARIETSEDIATFFHRDAGGPLVAGPALFAPANAGGAGAQPPVDVGPKSGRDVRWALAFAAPNASLNYSKGFITPLKDGGGYFVGGSSAIPAFLGVVSAEGAVQWMQTFPTGAKPVDGVQLPDGSVLVAGYAGFDWWVAKYDVLGNRQWIKSRRMQADLRSMAVGFSATGEPEIYLAGYQNLVIITQSDPIVLKLNQNGDVVWCKVYTLNEDDEVYSIRVLRDGNLLLTGNTDSKVGTDLFIGAGWNGLIMKINPAGEILWATSVPARWGMSLRDSAEGPDGSLYAVGYHGDIVRNYYPSILVAKFTSDGKLINHVLIGEDPDWDDVLPNGGDTPYDIAAQCAWVGDSLVVAGNTGLGVNVSAWVAKVTDELGVRWFSSFDGPGATTIGELTITDAGIATLGWLDNPWPGKFNNRSPAWLMSLPWEGIMRFHPTSGMQSHFMQPHVFLSSSHVDFIGRVVDASQRVTSVPTAPVPFGVSNAVTSAGANITAGVFTTFVTARLERLEPSIISTFDEWVAYNQLTGADATPAGDLDHDGVKNLWEFFTGRDPLVAQTNAPVGLSIAYDTAAGIVEIDFARALAAVGEPFALEYSVDLVNWMPAGGVTQEITAQDGTVQWWRLTLPAPDPNHAFFRLRIGQ